ncbi:ANK3 protein, partial [Acromyrmex charruanus]
MLKPESYSQNAKKIVEAQVIAAMQKQGYTLNAVNNYDENLLHISAANGCLGIVREILNQKENCRVIDRKNKFGWTPLMQAIRNGNIDTVKLLLERNSDVNQMTYLGMSVLGLAAAISKEMFETVYNACPDALANTANDDITPLCVAAMKNDKELFLRLLELGMPSSTTNGYTRIMMKHSTVPEIATLANEELAIDDYWNDTSDNIEIISEQNINSTTEDRPTSNDDENKGEKLKLLLLRFPAVESDKQTNKISPNLTYDVFTFPKADFKKDNLIEKSDVFLDENANESTENDLEKNSAMNEDEELESSPTGLQRLQSVRPIDLDIKNLSSNFNVTLGFTPEFSPVKSPNVPPDVNEENVFGENTPTPPRCKTPPKGMLLNWPQTKMIMVLKRFGLSQHIPIFLEQEVDFDLFLTLTDNDLIEIGIEHKKDRRDLLEAIKECINHKTY